MNHEEKIKEIKERCAKIKIKYRKNKNGLFSMKLRVRATKGSRKRINFSLGYYSTKEEAEIVFDKLYMAFYLYGEEKVHEEYKKYIKEENERRLSKIKGRYKELEDSSGYFISEYGKLYCLNFTNLLNQASRSFL